VRKRLRKKKKLAEFVEWGVLVKSKINLANEQELDKFMDEFIEKVEENNCYCGGGISLDKGLDMVIELGTNATNCKIRLEKITQWLKDHSGVGELKVGEIFDLWHNEPEDIEI
jgi:uncharacterized protein YggL (DUF469 family)